MKAKKLLTTVMSGALVVGLSIPAMAATTGGATTTAQSIMADLKTEGTFALVENQFYHYNTTVAASYFTNEYFGNVTVEIGGPGATSSTVAPAAPAAPTASEKELSKVIADNNNQQIFLDGGTLTGSTYTQTAKIETGSGKTKITFTYTYTYNIAPTGTVAPFTAWDLTKTTGDSSAHISITADIAGESVQVSKQNPTGKYSFSIGDDALTNRVTGLSITVGTLDADGNVVSSSTTATDSTIVKGEDFYYYQNAGAYGAANSYLKTNANASSILASDNFKGNDNGGADGSAMSRAVMTPVDVELGAGDYNITLSGSVKGNGIDLTPQSFEITKKIHIITPMSQNN